MPDIGTAGNRKFTEFLAKTFVCDVLYPVYGESSVTKIFQSWQGELMFNWCRFTNDDGNILEFYAEGQYVIRARNVSKDYYQLKTPRTINEFLEDMKKFGIQLFWSDWVEKKFKPKD